jgi:phosphate transport system substrate-binding protein
VRVAVGVRDGSQGATGLTMATDAVVYVADSDSDVRCLTVEQAQRLGEVRSLSELGDDPDTGAPLPGGELTFEPRTGAGAAEEAAARIADEQGALGALAYSEFLDAGVGGLKVVSIDGGHGCIPPGSETIQDGSYPLAFPLVLYFDPRTAAGDPAAAAFLRWLGDHQQQDADAAHVQSLSESGQRKAARLLGAPAAP